MFRFLFRLILLVVVVGVLGVLLLGWWPGGGVFSRQAGDRPIEPGRVDTSRAREVGAEISAKAAQAANQAQVALNDGSITAKIKAKMALDDSVKANDINVDFANGVVTLTGTVRTAAERKRAVDLARETQGVTSVTDRLATAER